MTEDEARTKWCPFARVVTTPSETPAAVRLDSPAGWNRYSGSRDIMLDAATCIGSACMAWRWAQKDFTFCAGTENTQRGGEVPPAELLKRGYREIARHKNGEGPAADQHRDTIEWFVPGHGFCGLAGAPE